MIEATKLSQERRDRRIEQDKHRQPFSEAQQSSMNIHMYICNQVWHCHGIPVLKVVFTCAKLI